MNQNDIKYASTYPSIWVCMIEGRFLKGKGGAMAWGRKNDAVTTFKHSEYWEWIVDELKANNPNLIEDGYRGAHWWRDRRTGAELEKQAYEQLLASGKVKYIEITPIPNWIA
jgi:hypothetical protein